MEEDIILLEQIIKLETKHHKQQLRSDTLDSGTTEAVPMFLSIPKPSDKNINPKQHLQQNWLTRNLHKFPQNSRWGQITKNQRPV